MNHESWIGLRAVEVNDDKSWVNFPKTCVQRMHGRAAGEGGAFPPSYGPQFPRLGHRYGLSGVGDGDGGVWEEYGT